MKIILYGQCNNALFLRIPPENVVAILEGTENMTVPKISLPTIAKSELLQWKYDYILIGGADSDNKYIELLRCLHIEESKIRTLDDLLCERCVENVNHFYYNELCLDGLRLDGRKRVLIVSQDMSVSGAPVALLELAKVLKKLGYQIFVYCQCGGPLVSEYIRFGIPVYVEDLLGKANLYFWILKNDFCFAVVNTLLQYQLIQKLGETSIRIFWWLHECDNYYWAILDREGYLPKLNSHVTPLFVGDKVKKDFTKFYRRQINCHNLLYSIPDREIITDKEKISEKIIFALIGAIVYRKGHDIFLEAIEQLDLELRSKCEFWIIGDCANEKSELLKLIYGAGQKSPEIRYWGPLPYHEMQKLYSDIDVVVCPSRIDPMPVVVTEGFMNKKVCLVSDSIGSALFIQDGINGFVFPSEDVAALTEKMAFIMCNLKDMKMIAEKGYEIYKSYFTNEKFEENVSKIIREYVEKDK